MLRGPDITKRVQSLTQALPCFPSTITIDSADVEAWSDIEGSRLQESANILSGKFEPTAINDPEGACEGQRTITLSYLLIGTPKADRIARRDMVIPAVEELLAGDRTLGLGDPQVYAEITDAPYDDEAPVGSAGSGSVVHIDITVTYVAPSRAG